MPGIPLLALVLTLSAAWFTGTARLSAQGAPGDTHPGAPPETQPAEGSYWLDGSSRPFLRQLPPLDEYADLEAPPLLEAAPERRSSAGPLGERGRAPFTARLYWIPARDLKHQLGELAMHSEEIELAFPARIDPDGIWLALGSIERLEISTAALLPDSGLPVPDQFWDIEAGTMHMRDLGGGWRTGGMVRVGSPSDRPFGALRDMTVTLLGFLTIPSGERDGWNFSLFYSPTGQIIFPIPGVAYVWRPTSQFQANLGIPFSVEYHATETLTFTAGYRPLTDVNVLVRQALGEYWSVYGGYRSVTETFLLADRVDDRERTYVFDQRLTLGIQRELGQRWSVDLSAAYVFDRHIFQAEKFSGSRRDELMIDPGVAGTLQFQWTR